MSSFSKIEFFFEIILKKSIQPNRIEFMRNNLFPHNNDIFLIISERKGLTTNKMTDLIWENLFGWILCQNA